jgi:uncharacterized protein YndB with AHSA1/START domain
MNMSHNVASEESRLARIEATTAIAAPVERVWEVLTDWEAQALWMADVRSIQVVSPQRSGRGVVLRVQTDIVLGVLIRDEVTVTEWQEHERIGVRHRGPLYSAVGAYELSPTETGTRLIWWDELKVPLGIVGDTATALMVGPFARRTFRRSLANLKRICEADHG